METSPDVLTVAAILAAMAGIAGLETLVPLRRGSPGRRRHLAPNLTLTLLTFATNAVLNGVLVAALAASRARGFGLLATRDVGPALDLAIVVGALDLAFYACHVAMHRVALFWRCHRVHHADPFVDVTTTIRQHPGETLIRAAFTAAVALPLGASPQAFAVYRLCSALVGLLEHANLAVPAPLDRALAWVTTFPHLHKVHHSRREAETNSNYGNLFSLFDRAFGTFTPSARGRSVAYGLDGYDDPATQSVTALLALPFQRRRFTARAGADPRRSSPARPS